MREKHIHVKVIILSSVTEIKTIKYALRNGASGYLTKDASSEELAEAIPCNRWHGTIYRRDTEKVIAS